MDAVAVEKKVVTTTWIRRELMYQPQAESPRAHWSVPEPLFPGKANSRGVTVSKFPRILRVLGQRWDKSQSSLPSPIGKLLTNFHRKTAFSMFDGTKKKGFFCSLKIECLLELLQDTTGKINRTVAI